MKQAVALIVLLVVGVGAALALIFSGQSHLSPYEQAMHGDRFFMWKSMVGDDFSSRAKTLEARLKDPTLSEAIAQLRQIAKDLDSNFQKFNTLVQEDRWQGEAKSEIAVEYRQLVKRFIDLRPQFGDSYNELSELSGGFKNAMFFKRFTPSVLLEKATELEAQVSDEMKDVFLVYQVTLDAQKSFTALRWKLFEEFKTNLGVLTPSEKGRLEAKAVEQLLVARYNEKVVLN